MTEPFARVARADFAPGACIRCGYDQDLLDLGAGDVPMYGRPYLCTKCFAELADNMEYVAPEVYDSAREAFNARLAVEQALSTGLNRELTSLRADALQGVPAEYERFIHDLRTFLATVDSVSHDAAGGGGGGPRGADDAPVVPVGGVDDGGDGGVEDETPRPAAKPRGRKPRATTARDGVAVEAGTSVPDGDSLVVVEGDGAGEPDFDEWAASLADADGEDAGFDDFVAEH